MKQFLEKIDSLISKHRWIVVFLCAIPFFNDGYTPVRIIPDWIMDYFKILVFAVLLILMVVRKKRVSPLFISLSAFEIWWLITTIINYSFGDSEMYHKLICDIVNALVMGLIVEYFKDDPKSLLSGLMLSLELAIYPELLTVILDYPGARYYILGYYSTAILWILPAFAVASLYILINKKYVRGLLMIAACFALNIMLWCATMIVSLLGQVGLFLLGLVLMKFGKTKNIKLSLTLFVLLAILGNLFVLFVYTGGSFPLIDTFIEKVLRRSTTFTERTVIWEEAIRMIKEKPIVGHGFRPVIHAQNSFGDSYIHSHNQLLQRLNATGAIGLILFAVFHVILCIKVDKSKNTIERLAMVSCVFGVCITYITEAYRKFFRFYLVFFLAYHIEELIKDKIHNRDYLFK